MTGRNDDLETAFQWVSIAIVLMFSTAFAVGLAIYFVAPGSATALTALNAGLLLLIASPVARISIATAERIRRRDWGFVLMVGAIALELVVVLWRAVEKA